MAELREGITSYNEWDVPIRWATGRDSVVGEESDDNLDPHLAASS